MRISLLPALTAVMLTLAGCVPSLHPLYTLDDLVFDPALLGTWRSEDLDTWQILRAPGDSYEVVVVADEEARRMEGYLVKVGEERFLDLYPAEPDIKNDFYAAHLLRVHHFVRIRFKEGAIEAAVLDDGWLSKQLEANRYPVRHEKVGDDYILIAQPRELQAFLRAVAGEKDAFTEPGLYRRVR